MTDSAKTFRAACVQLTSSNEVAPNIEMSSALIREAAAKGADFVLLPEMVSLLEQNSKNMFARVVPQGDDKALKAYRALADELSIWLLAGSLPILIEEGKVANRSFLLNDKGEIAATYDKIHLFDVDLPNGERYRESKNYVSSARAWASAAVSPGASSLASSAFLRITISRICAWSNSSAWPS